MPAPPPLSEPAMVTHIGTQRALSLVDMVREKLCFWFILSSLIPNGKMRRHEPGWSISSDWDEPCPRRVKLRSLRRYYPDQVQWVNAERASQPYVSQYRTENRLALFLILLRRHPNEFCIHRHRPEVLSGQEVSGSIPQSPVSGSMGSSEKTYMSSPFIYGLLKPLVVLSLRGSASRWRSSPVCSCLSGHELMRNMMFHCEVLLANSD